MRQLIRISGEWKAVRDLAVQNGCTPKKANELLLAMRNAFKKISSDVDVFVTKPREINITGARINSAIEKNKLTYPAICKLHQSANPNTEVLGSIIVATPNEVCKGIFISPNKNILEGYVKAAEQLAKSDFSPAVNNTGYIQYIN